MFKACINLPLAEQTIIRLCYSPPDKAPVVSVDKRLYIGKVLSPVLMLQRMMYCHKSVQMESGKAKGTFKSGLGCSL